MRRTDRLATNEAPRPFCSRLVHRFHDVLLEAPRLHVLRHDRVTCDQPATCSELSCYVDSEPACQGSCCIRD